MTPSSETTDVSMKRVAKFDPIMDEFELLAPNLAYPSSTYAKGKPHIDIRKLGGLGRYTSNKSLQALSQFFIGNRRPISSGSEAAAIQLYGVGDQWK